ncbi:MAG: TetR/AcrR family transcriptional regulator [Ruminococcus sp.]|nr:TetR/AcrR family transcriptional regulator [Ruminococcus sp.]
MIKRTFYNLPPEKREKIIEVTRKEFRKGNKKKITINSVIKSAGISRGSFYQYFDDKLDLVELMTNDMMDKMVGFIKNELIEDGGDMFQVPMKIFDVMTSDEINYKDIVVMTDRTNLNFDLVSEYMQYRFHEYDFTAKLAPYVDYSRMSLKNDEDLKYVVFMMEDAIRSAMVNVAKNAKAHKKEREILRKKIELLQRAVEYK